ncbi:MAG: serine/threonine-protein phosphatase [Oscillospiraceae bacterium]|nr:serine/threonine-protein phosphatase [Oscillospiraceae bacterium]
MFYCCGITEKGLKEKNEDAILIHNTVMTEGKMELRVDHPFMMAVCDGVSGEKSGDVAARMCLGELAKSQFDSELNLQQKISRIHKQLKHYGLFHKSSENMQTTICGFAVDENEAMYCINVGDSRLYRFRDTILKQISRDQSLVQMLYDQGKIAYEEKRKHVHRNIIMPVLGNNDSKPVIDINLIEEKAENGDVYLVCSDGLSDYTINSEIEEILSMPMSMSKRLELLVENSLNKGCKDNISIVAATYIANT